VPPKSIAILAFALCLGGCANTTGRFGALATSGYAPSAVSLAVSDGPIPVVVRNNPFPDDADLAKFAAAMPNDNQWRMKFVPSRASPGFGYRFVVEFNDTGGLGGPSVCATDLPAPPPPRLTGEPRGIPFRAGFCRQGSGLSEIAGVAPDAPTAADPDFRKFLANLVTLLTPSVEPWSQRGGDPLIR